MLQYGRDTQEHRVPKSIKGSHKLENVVTRRLGIYKDGDMQQAVACIDTSSHGEMNVFVTGLLEHYPEQYETVRKLSEDFDHEVLMKRAVDPKWPDWEGLVTSHDMKLRQAEIAFDVDNRVEFSYTRNKLIIIDDSGGRS